MKNYTAEKLKNLSKEELIEEILQQQEALLKKQEEYNILLERLTANNVNTFSRKSEKMVYIPPPKPQLHGLGTALCRTLNRTLPEQNRSCICCLGCHISPLNAHGQCPSKKSPPKPRQAPVVLIRFPDSQCRSYQE